MQDNVTTVDTSAGPRPFGFDRCYWSHDNFAESDDGVLIPASDSSPYASQQHIFEDLGATLVTNVLAGYNACAMAYGQTSAGKSYTMIGTPTNPGLVPRLCAALFAAPVPNKVQRQVTLSMLEIYNEQINDLLASSTALHECRVRQHPKQGFFVEGLTRVPVNDHADVQARMQVGTKLRTTAATNMNKTSSRSHMVVTLHVKQTQVNGKGESTTKTSDIHLVDLAGSERTDLAGTSDQRFKEGLAINQSLSNLGNVIAALADQATTIPYRNSVLTKLLSNALGGNSRTMMIANISPSPLNLEETLSTLRFADRAKRIKCKAVVNESPTDKLIRELKEENQRLLDMLKAAGSDADSDALRADKAECKGSAQRRF
ncbi:uncharacterized protein MONBRDRAFT_9005 [Monosiga brevicollis MX1]|uniref:Kinesin motor domain-containing protein n=1 Tax=Monosiga brevicollis TaxID=81824 RepID=A9V1T1_MONBE|nr:uncharacterized protein MONBRDRAFT_9005 [Monosiga brevicollis MX1]EDQ88497.1 predicted protein [Monosiga brevicollis MX1]|eukprot:XP_001746601.1 hypothetical protein [Monosiga brevicollis MX1]